MHSIDKEILHEFLWTTREETQRLETALLSLERQGLTDGAIDALYRHFHSLKGAAGLVQLARMEQATHTCESLLAPLRGALGPVPADAIALLLQCVDGVKLLLGRLDAGLGEEPDAFAAVLGDQATPSPASPAVAPPVGELDSLIALMASEQVSPPVSVPLPVQPPVQQVQQVVSKPAPQPVAVTAAAAKPVEAVAPAEVADTAVRVDITLLDRLMNLVGELVLARNQMLRLVARTEDPQWTATAQAINQVTSDVQEHVMRTRMQPIGNIFGKLPRLMRDLSRQLEKQIDLDIHGKETELDRTILESLRDPFTHIIRNACDHGIERPDVRTAAGKPAKGTITIRAFHEGGQVIVEIKDDGKGIDGERIKAKAIALKVITEAQAARFGDSEILALICHPGLSTADQVTNISGRGVGMDVVKKNIEKLGGQLEITSKVGRGSTFRLRIPLTLAIIPALMVHAAGQLFGIPQINLVELVHIDKGSGLDRIEQVSGAEVYRLRDELLALVRIDRIFGIERESKQPDEPFFIAVVANGSQRFGIIVDEILEAEEIVVKPLSRHLAGIDVFAGATIRGDGRVALILDLGGIGRSTGETAVPQSEITKVNESREDQGEFLVFDLGHAEQFAIPLPLVERIERHDPSALSVANGLPVLCHDGRLTTTISLDRYTASDPLVQDGAPIYAIIMHHSSGAAVLAKRLVDSRLLDLHGLLEGNHLDGNSVSLGMLVVDGIPTSMIDAPRLLDCVFPETKRKTTLPSAPISASAGASIPQETAKKPAVLFCDDAPFFQKVVGSYLREAGLDVVICNNGKEGWDLLEKDPERFALLITDLEMPEMDGWELIKQVRQYTRFDRLPVVAITSLNDEAVRQRTLQFGASEFAVKLKRDELLGIVDRHISRPKTESLS